jgi:hypothetical protein
LAELFGESVDIEFPDGSSCGKSRFFVRLIQRISMQKEWVESILRQCDAQRVAFFFKQWGGVNKRKAGRELNGKTYDAMPQLTQISQVRKP